MIVAHVVRQYLPSVGGLEDVVRNLVKFQVAQGHTPYIVTLNRVFNQADKLLPEIEYIDGVKVIRISYCGSNRYPLAPSVLKYLAQADIVHVHAIDFFYDFLAITKWIHGKKIVVSTHGGFFHTTYAGKLKRLYFKTITKFSSFFYDKIIGCSDNDGDIFRQIVKSDKLIVIENGVDVNKLASPNPNVEVKPNIIYFGRWSVNKGLVEAIHFFSELTKKDTNIPWKFVIAGRPYDLNESDINRIAKEYGVSSQLEININPTDDELKKLVNSNSYFLCLSKHEGFGIAPIEAMSAGLYPLLSDIPPFLKLIKATSFGEVIHNDLHDSAQNVLKLHLNKSWNHEALVTSVQKYSWNNVGNHYHEVYERILHDD